jgi:5-methylcytosine-specific restriction endonuclease McrA
MLPIGIGSMLDMVPGSHQIPSPRFKTSMRTTSRRRSRRPKELRIMYDLQKGRCYFCSKPLGRYGARGAFVRDHLRPLLSPYRAYSDHTDFGNLALTCWGCNEDKNKRDEKAFWKILQVRRGSAWVERQQRAMAGVRRWREQYDVERQCKAKVVALSWLDAFVEAEYQKKL